MPMDFYPPVCKQIYASRIISIVAACTYVYQKNMAIVQVDTNTVGQIDTVWRIIIIIMAEMAVV